MLIAITVVLMLALVISAATTPRWFVLLALWTLSVPYGWNFDLQASFNTPIGQLNILSISVFGLCLACGIALISAGGLARALEGRYAAHLAFLAFCTASLAYAPSIPFGLRMLAKLVAPFLFLLVVLATVNDDQGIDAIRKAIVGNGLLILALALLARVLGLADDPNAVLTGEVGLGPPGMGPPVFSAHMLPVAMIALAQYLTTRRIAYLLLLAACAAGILAAHQRTSAAALYLGCSLILGLGARGIWRMVMPAAGVVGIPALFIFNASFRRRMFFGNLDSTQLIADPTMALSRINGSGRFGLWDEVLNRFYAPHPFQGSGLGATQQFLYSSQNNVGVVHSEYVRLLCELGIAGLVLFALAAIVYVGWLARRVRQSRGSVSRSAALAAIGSLIAYLVFMTTDNGFDYVGQLGIYVFALVAVAARAQSVSQPEGLPKLERASAIGMLPNLMT